MAKKYIDTDKLKELINEKWKELADENVKIGGGKWDAEISTYLSVLGLIDSLQQEQNSIQDTELTGFESALFTAFSYAWQSYLRGEEVNVVQWVKDCSKDLLEAARCQQEQQEIDLEKFTEKMDFWKARYNNYPNNVIVKGTMAFTARMFYMYPNVAREWYDSLSKVTLD